MNFRIYLSYELVYIWCKFLVFKVISNHIIYLNARKIPKKKTIISIDLKKILMEKFSSKTSDSSSANIFWEVNFSAQKILC